MGPSIAAPGSRSDHAPVLFRNTPGWYPGSGKTGVRGRKARGLTMNRRGGVTGRGGSLSGLPRAGTAAGPAGEPRPRSGGRESIESFVVVFLAFLIWSLEAEGFVIPTGSMAPTLMGRHKEITCPECGYVVHRQRRPRGRAGPARPRHGSAGRVGGPARIAGSRPPSTMRRASRATGSTS